MADPHRASHDLYTNAHAHAGYVLDHIGRGRKAAQALHGVGTVRGELQRQATPAELRHRHAGGGRRGVGTPVPRTHQKQVVHASRLSMPTATTPAMDDNGRPAPVQRKNSTGRAWLTRVSFLLSTTELDACSYRPPKIKEQAPGRLRGGARHGLFCGILPLNC